MTGMRVDHQANFGGHSRRGFSVKLATGSGPDRPSEAENSGKSRPRPPVRPPLTGRRERIRLIEGIPPDGLASQSPGSVRLLRLVAREQGFGSHAGGPTAASP